MTGRADQWVVLDDRPTDPDVVAAAAASQASLGALIERLRATRFPQLPVPPDGREVAP